jgi:hypothetical protein
MLTWFELLFAGAGGYVASIFTWERVRSWLLGAQAELDGLRAKVRALENKLRG